ncbi:glutamate receptor ionotropic, delta-2-like [Scylla paramamosain]|uniref:glutamate receptor ionotropic, delta-2-like n=1 Tax=Scylla paramamosain TaxID=85552 RepID=UPI0030829B12
MLEKEVNIGLGLFAINPKRTAVIEFTVPMLIGSLKIFGGQRSPQVDPWGFLLPLAPLVWTATMAALVLVSAAVLLPYVRFHKRADVEEVVVKTLNTTGILRQLIWWERLVLGLWMLTTLVLAKSYAGHLMSLLAVRHVPQPFQSLQDVLDAPHVIMIWHEASSPAQNMKDATSGIFYEVKKTEGEGRLQFLPIIEYPSVLSDVRILSMNEAGLFQLWFQNARPNATACTSSPTKVTVSASFSLTNIWAMFVVLIGGQALGLLFLCLEVLHARICFHPDQKI